MEVIALTGSASCGKTHTLNALCWYMPSHGFTEIAIGLPYERIAVFTTKDNERVAVIVKGDDAAQLKADLEAVQNAGCIKVICSCRNSGETFIIVQRYKHQLIPKTVVAIQDGIVKANREDMFTLFGLL